MMLRSYRVSDLEEDLMEATMEHINNRPVWRRMTDHLSHRRFQLVAFLLVMSIVCWTGVTLATRSDNARSVAALEDSDAGISAAKLVEARARPTAQGAALRTIVETVAVRLGADGFDPAEVTQPRGTFFLMVENETGLEELALRLDRETGSRIHQVDVPRKKRDWAEGFDLPPGRYFLTEANHPKWSCTITITPQ